jgi:hypothetical protein
MKNEERLIRPQSLFIEEQTNKSFDVLTPITNQRKSSINYFNSLRKTKSLHNVDQQEQLAFVNKSAANLTNEQIFIIEQFLKVFLTFLFY